MRIYSILLVAIISLLFSGSIFSQSDTVQISKYEEFARFVAGKQFPESVKDTTINLDFWYEYQSKVNEDWSVLDSTRLIPMSIWEKEEIGLRINDTLTLFYPFSGPDFLHAYVLFPNAGEYIFLAQEILGRIPDLSTMKASELADYLDKFYYSIRDIYERSYFITGRMINDLNNDKIKGILPLVLFFMAQTDHYIHDVKYEKLATKNSFTEIKSVTGRFSAGECINITFFVKDSDVKKTFRYFRCDLSDTGLSEAPLFNSYLSDLKNINTYVKSASYLLHYETFTGIRNMILNNSRTVLEDDTGIPYKYFKPQNWDSFLYGVYVKPIEDFPNQYLFQKDLKSIYESGKNIYPLSFSLGYHWRSGDQNQMLFIKK
ncbi:MAG: hypothetical protein LBQ22_09820 [Bacteroidales bacterium]|jgi:hypothetical protein|nr:hypothetical protein [Bacteroidales bacterium]